MNRIMVNNEADLKLAKQEIAVMVRGEEGKGGERRGGEGRGGEGRGGEKYEERGLWERERKEWRQVGERQDSVLSVRGQGR